MIPEWATFDGDSVSVHFPANPHAKRGWWDAAATHRFAHQPQLTNLKRLIDYALRGYKLSERKRNALARFVKPRPCGDGTLVELDLEMIRSAGGRVRIGRKLPVFLLAPRGRLGALVIGTSVYHKYNVNQIHVGKMHDFRWLPKLSVDQQEMATFARSFPASSPRTSTQS